MIYWWIVLVLSTMLTTVDMDATKCSVGEYMHEVGPVCTFVTRDASEPVVFLIIISVSLVALMTVYMRTLN